MAEQKTNVMRILEQKKIPYTAHAYPHGDEAVDGVQVAELIGRPAEQVFKTLVTVGASKKNYVFVIPVDYALDLKKAAKAAGEKSVAMLKASGLLGLTGYVRGGCSPIGMKKLFPTYIHETCVGQDTIIVSAGKIGQQVELAPNELLKLVHGRIADVAVKE